MPTATIMCDGFDKYGPPGNQNLSSVAIGDWVTVVLATVVTGLSSPGYAFRLDSITGGATAGALTSPTFPGGSLARVAGSIRLSSTTVNTMVGGVTFFNTATACFSIIYNYSLARYELRTGGSGGSTVAAGGSPASGSTHVLSWDVTLGANSAYAVYLDGVLLFSGTGNTGNGQSTCNKVQILTTSSASIVSTLTVDDFCVFDPTQAGYNSAFVTSNVIVETKFPTGDNQTLFANDGDVAIAASVATNGIARATASTNAPGAGQLFLVKIAASVSDTINSVSVIPGATSAAANLRAVIYSDSAGAPGSLLSSGTQVTGTTTGVTLTGALVTPQALVAGTSYWIGFITDTSVVLQQYDATTNLGQKKANTYASGAPAGPLSGMTAGQPEWLIWGNCTGSTVNWAAVGRNPPLATAASQIHSATPSQEDLYTFPALTTTPATIFGWAVKGFVSKSDSGARTISFNMKSGASDSTGSNPGQALSTAPQWQATYGDVDPGTGGAFVASAANSAKSGVSVAS